MEKILKRDEEKKFRAFELLRQAGHCNMFDINSVKKYTRLDKNDILLIMKNYTSLYNKYYLK